MDKLITVEKLKDKVQNFCQDREWDQFHNPKELAIGISTEANELLEIFRFQTAEQMKAQMEDPKTRQQIEEEIADTFFFLLRFAQMYQIDLDEALEHKMDINGKRYTIERSKGKNSKIPEKR